MTPDHQHWDIAERIHDAAMHPAQWYDTLTALADYLEVDGCQCLAMDRTEDRVPFGAVGRIDPAAQADYEAHYFALDFRRPRYLDYTPYTLFTDRDITTAAERRTSPFHQEFLVKYDCEHLLLANFPLGGTLTGVVIAGRSATKHDFSAETRQHLLRLLPPFRTAIRVRLEMQRLQSHARSLEDLLERRAFGVFLLDGAGRIRYANGEARRVMAPGDCLRVRQGRLLPVGSDALTRYTALLSVLQQRGSSATALAPVVLRLKRPGGKPGIDLMLRPIRCTGWPIAPGDAEFAVIVIDAAVRQSLDVDVLLRLLYGFTNAEGRVASLLREGWSLNEIAERLGLAKTTVRAHLRSLFRKTGTRRQGELVACLHHALLLWARREEA